jgi:hypothetical protein
VAALDLRTSEDRITTPNKVSASRNLVSTLRTFVTVPQLWPDPLNARSACRAPASCAKAADPEPSAVVGRPSVFVHDNLLYRARNATKPALIDEPLIVADHPAEFKRSTRDTPAQEEAACGRSRR